MTEPIQDTRDMIPDNSKPEAKLPSDSWQVWALLEHYFANEYRKSPVTPLSAAELCADRLAKLLGDNPDAPVKRGKRSYILKTNSGHWGRGIDLQHAAKQAIKAGARRTEIAFAVMVLNDETPEVNDWGQFISSSDSVQLTIGTVGKLGGLL